MAKGKASQDAGKIPNKAMHSRVSYLYQAATYLATQQQQHSQDQAAVPAIKVESKRKFTAARDPGPTMARLLISDLRDVSLKAQLRISPAVKRSICKSCDTLLIEGSTCSSQVENKSRGGRKPWADIIVRICNACGASRRFPVAAERQKRRPNRDTGVAETARYHEPVGKSS